MVERTMAASPESAAMPATNRRSTLISLTAKRCRKDSEEKPVPKSSTDSWTPRARNPVSTCSTTSSSLTMTVSVISRISCEGASS